MILIGIGATLHKHSHESSTCLTLGAMNRFRRARGGCPSTMAISEHLLYCSDQLVKPLLTHLPSLRQPSRPTETAPILHDVERRQPYQVAVDNLLEECPWQSLWRASKYLWRLYKLVETHLCSDQSRGTDRHLHCKHPHIRPEDHRLPTISHRSLRQGNLQKTSRQRRLARRC
jgi:hypothetical protein